MKKDILKSFKDIAEVIENDSSMTLINPVLGDVVFSNGTFGNLKKKNTGGFGIKHIIEGRYRKDGFTKEQITSLLYLIKDAVETVAPVIIDKPKINLVKNGIWVGITRNWLDTDENWIVTGFGEFNKEQELKKEAADAINAVSAKYGYTPEFLSVGKQVGAVIASCNILPQSQENSNTKESSINSKFNQLAKEYNGLLKEFDENIKDYNELLSAYNKSQEENKKLKNQINSQNNNSIQR